jgi:hypothetical protein
VTVAPTSDDPRTATLLLALISAFTPAIYAPTWVPWLRWVGTGCVLVVIMLVIRMVTGAALPALT